MSVCSLRNRRRSFQTAMAGMAGFLGFLIAATGQPLPDSDGVNPSLSIGKNADGQLELFTVDSRGHLCHRSLKKANGQWSPWSSLGGALFSGVAVANNASAELQAFAVNRANQTLQCIGQLATNSEDWSAWTNLGGRLAGPVVAGQCADGRLEVFAMDAATHAIDYIWQNNAQGDWSRWAALDGSVGLGMVVAKNKDGRLELFVLRRSDGMLLHRWQLHANAMHDWSPWVSMGRSVRPGFTVAQSATGHLSVFGVSADHGPVRRICQSAPSESTNWTGWKDFGGDARPGLAAAQGSDGRLEIFAVDAGTTELLHRWEKFANDSDQWSDWAGTGQATEPSPAVAPNEDGDLEVFAFVPTSHALVHRRQISASSDWLDWSRLDRPVFQNASRSWQTDSGLPDNLVQAIAQTRDGFLWVGTHGGLVRFDGTQFTSYDAKNTPAIRNSSIEALCADRDGGLWIGTDGGGLLQLKDGVFSHFGRSNGLAGDSVRAIYQGKDNALWIGTTAGLSRFEQGQFSTYSTRDGLLSDVITCIYEDRDANLWIATDKGLNRLRPTGKMDAFAMPNGLPNDSVRCLCQDAGGRIWIGSNNGLLWYNWYWENAFYAYNTKYGLSDPFVSAICEDADGNLWVGTYSGLNRFRDGRFYNQPGSDGQLFDRVNVLFVDREGDLWVGSRDGLSRLTPEHFVTYSKQQGLTHNNITSVMEDRSDSLWLGTWGGGLDQLKQEKVSAYAPTNGLTQDLILSLCEGHDGSVWVGADFDGGLTRLQDGKITRYTWRDGLLNSGLRVLHEEKSGKLWVGSGLGLNCFLGGKFVTNEVTRHFAGETIRDVCEDDAGALWFATANGLQRYQNGHFTIFTTKDGLSDNSVEALYLDTDNLLWIGTGGGLTRYRDGRLTSYTTHRGLFSDEIFGIIGDDNGWLWMSCPKGIFRVRKGDFDDFDRGERKNIASIAYGKTDGIESPQCNGVGKPSCWKSRDGRLWFPTTKGLVTVDPKTVRVDAEASPVFIETVTADAKTIEDGRSRLSCSTTSNFQSEMPAVRVPPGRGELEFHYAALDFSAPEKTLFKYRLEGVDTNWIDAGPRRVAHYTHLLPGPYRFLVKACNQDGVWNEAAASAPVIVLPHYWQTEWFRILAPLLVIASIAGITLYALRQRLKRKRARLEQQQTLARERSRIARDMHDQIGAGLTQIGLLGEFARRDAARKIDLEVHATKISDLARDLAQTLDEMVWMVNPRNDTLNKMGIYLASYAEDFFRHTSIQCRFDIPPGLPEIPVSAELRHNIFLTVKEALNNIVKHSHASEAWLRLSLDDAMLEISVEDDGVGIPPGISEMGGNGLSNMKERVEDIGGQFLLESVSDKGTRVCLRVSMRQVLFAGGHYGRN
jgi:ligand-binding sensor domain-containing protein/signal transduction histidine kinase